MPGQSPLDDPKNAAFAWARYRRLMWLVALVALVAVILTCAFFYVGYGFLSIHFYIALILGVGATIMLAGALMGLAFLSHGVGHDEAIDDPISDQLRGKK